MESLIAQTAERIFADHVDKALLDRAEALGGGVFPDALWRTVQDAGLHLVGRPDSGSELGDLFGLLKVAGRHALPMPLAEVLVANALLPDVPDGAGFTTIAMDDVAPWARVANQVLDLYGNLHVSFTAEPGANIAGEPRDRVHAGQTVAVAVPWRTLSLHGPVANVAHGRGTRAHHGDGRRLRDRAVAVRPSHRQVPGHPAQLGRARWRGRRSGAGVRRRDRVARL